MNRKAWARPWLIPAAVIASILTVGSYSYTSIKRSLTTNLAAQLETTIRTSAASLVLWASTQRQAVGFVGEEDRVRTRVGDLLMLARTASPGAVRASRQLNRVRNTLHPTLAAGHYVDLLVTDIRTGVTVASMLDEPIGQRTQFHCPDLVEQVAAGNSILCPPTVSPSTDRAARRTVSMAVSGPVRDSEGNVMAILSFQIRPESEFFQLLTRVQSGRTGETFAFDSSGTMLSPSRFDPDRNFQRLVDPTSPSVAGEPLLTTMAASALAGENGVDVQGYRDYRGVRVVGAWIWLHEYGLGVAAKMDWAEAFGPLHRVQWAFLAVFGTMAAAGGLAIVLHYRELRRAEAMRETTARLNATIASSPLGIFLTDVNGDCLYTNPAYHRICGLSLEETLGTGWQRGLHPDDRAGVFQRWYECAPTQAVFSSEHRFLHPDGAVVWSRVTAAAIRDGERMLGYVGAVEDTTRHRLAEEEIRQARDRFERAVRGAGAGIWDWDLAAGSIYYSPRFKSLLGYAEEEVENSTRAFLDRTHPDDRRAAWRRVRRHLQTREPYADEFRLRLRDGEYRWFQAKGQAVWDESGRPIRMAGSVSDVDDHRKTLDRLRESEQQLALALDASNQGLWDWNILTGELFASTALEALLEYGPGELPRTKEFLDSLVCPEDEPAVTVSLRPHLEGLHATYESEHRLLTKSGAWTWVLARGKVVSRDDSGRPLRMTGTYTDITQRKRMEQEVWALIEAAEAASKAKSDFLATMSHEIRTPMNGVIGMSGLLLDTGLNEEQRDYAETVRTSAESLLGLINDILDFSKVEAGKLELENVEFDLRVAVEESLDLLAEKAAGKNLDLAGVVAEELPSTVAGDPGRLRQILLNLLSNAVKFTGQGAVTVRAFLEADLGNSLLARFEIQDTGIGIPAESQNQLFGSFFQVDASTSRKYGGTGLGLAICKRLAGLMGGDIGVRSEPGQGSTFWFSIQLEKRPQQTHRDPGFGGKRVLLADVNGASREHVRALLSGWGVETTVAESAEEFSRMQDSGSYDLLLVDRRWRGSLAAQTATPVILLAPVAPGAARAHGGGRTVTTPVRGGQLRRTLAALWGLAGEQPAVTQSMALAAAGRHARVLVAEDNTVNQKLAVRLLEKRGFRVDVVCNGLEAVDAVQRIPYDIVLMDCQMPEMDGFQATQQIRNLEAALQRHIPVIAMTANAMQGDKERCLEAGLDDYVSKPIRPNQLYATIDQWLARDSSVAG